MWDIVKADAWCSGVRGVDWGSLTSVFVLCERGSLTSVLVLCERGPDAWRPAAAGQHRLLRPVHHLGDRKLSLQHVEAHVLQVAPPDEI